MIGRDPVAAVVGLLLVLGWVLTGCGCSSELRRAAVLIAEDLPVVLEGAACVSTDARTIARWETARDLVRRNAERLAEAAR